MNKLTLTLLVASIISVDVCMAQSSEEEDAMDENILESVLTNSDDVTDMLTPVDINEADEDDLLSVPGMTGACAAAIVAYRKKNGFIRSIGEISHIEGMTPGLMSSIAHRVVIVERSSLHMNVMSYVSLSLQRSSLFDEAYGELGVMNFQKLSLSYKDIEISAVTDKDPGEINYSDFYSVSVSAGRLSGLSGILAGDYTLALGNGLLFSRGGMVSKSAGAVTPLFTTRSYALKPYRSKGENKFLRGIAMALPVGAFEITTFGSSKLLAARANDSGMVSSIDYTGLHLPGQASREKLLERIGGAIARYESPEMSAGMSAVYFSYDRNFESYYSKEVVALESCVRLILDGLAFSVEVLSDELVPSGSNYGLDYGEARFAVGLRDLRSRILQNYSGPLSESFPTAPEKGLYFGAVLRPSHMFKLGFYYDRFRISSLSGGPDRNGEEFFADSYITLSRTGIFEGGSTVIYMRYRYKTKEDSYIPAADFPVALSVIAGSKQSARIDFRHKFAASFSFRVRAEMNFISSGERGDLIVFDAGWRLKKASFDTRVCFYRTDSYSSAFYTVEKDLPHVAEFTVFYGDGARLFLLGSWEVNGSLSAGLKIARDIYSRERAVSVGTASRSLQGATDVSLEIGYRLD